ncbi:hypothetical protein GALMADRAFT_1062899 [Galerina marginata CBS 339.88]|uniref:F-box domain-containing protein n=1 Tax=Galerina marginata (strain CBS 339.88) TaxID=685588 RepID=A0A067SAB9_GALM3|nr:hypothetical protein GALMADRAFT_1062899 [Galerina marginata CBS 339.88]
MDLGWITLAQFLNECPNLINLALWSHHPTKQLLNSIEKMSLQRLSTNLSSLDEQDFKGPAFSCITHLDITGLKGDWARYKVLTHVPQLTHIAINEVVDMQAIHHLLQYCPKLQILLVVTYDIPSWNLDLEDIHLYDPRLVLMEVQRFTLAEWTNGTNGKEDLWEGPEVISASKTYGRIKKEQFCTWFSGYTWRRKLDDLEVGGRGVI